ncbi:MAG: ABC transporter permease [Dehalococcoidia bacterium]
MDRPLTSEVQPATTLRRRRSQRRPLRTAGALLGDFLAPAVALAVGFAFWEAWARGRDIPVYLVPPPSRVLERLWGDPSFFVGQGLVTLYEALVGLAFGGAAAVAIAVVMAHSRLAEKTLFPIAILIKVTPIVAVAPLFAIWFGFGLTPKVLIAALISFFPLLVNAITGFRSVNPDALAFLASIHASPLAVFLKLRLPSSLPYLFAAVKVALPLALIGAVVAEWFSASEGLGLVIFTANGELDTPTLFAAVTVLAVMGVVLNVLVSLLERRVLFWYESFRSG